jgi:prevent-host-death family protein
MAREVSVRELRNRTADVMRAVEAGQALVLTVNRRPVAEIVPHDAGPEWVASSVVRAIAAEAPADRALLTELADSLGQSVDEL